MKAVSDHPTIDCVSPVNSIQANFGLLRKEPTAYADSAWV